MIARLLDLGAPSVYLHGGIAEQLSKWLRPETRKRLKMPMNVEATALEGAVLLARGTSRSARAKGQRRMTSLMLDEAREAPEAVAAHARRRTPTLCRELGARLRRSAPPFAVSCARGSSDNAATYAKYLLEIRLGIVTASVGPSVRSVYAAAPDRQGRAVPRDLAVRPQPRHPLSRGSGARRRRAHRRARQRRRLAARRSSARSRCRCTPGPRRASPRRNRGSARWPRSAQLVAHWADDRALLDALDRLPDDLLARLARPTGAPPSPASPPPSISSSSARGIGLAVAQEAALKLKETCGVHAEALSAAELMHGPLTLAGPDFPVLVFSQPDERLPERRRPRLDPRRARRAGDRGGTGGGGRGPRARRRPERSTRSSCRSR